VVLADAAGGEEVRSVDAVVLAVPAPAWRRLLADVAPAASEAAGGIELASSIVVALAYPGSLDLGAHSGVLIGAGERRPDGLPWTIKAVTFSSVKWPHLRGSHEEGHSSAGGAVVLRASIGRHGDTVTLQRDDDDLLAAARDDLAQLARLHAEPLESAVVRWGGGLPQYGVGHGDRVAAIEDGVAGLPGLAVAGAALHGVGVPACLASGDAAAARIAAGLRRAATADRTYAGRA
jgi:oxygen-dependent protoporphyrinogen oxidase